MSRMLDMIAKDGLQPHIFVRAKRDGWNDNFSEVREMILSSTAILADNVADYYYAGTAKENWDLLTDFPNLAPPFEKFWIEFKPPAKMLSGDTVIDLNSELSYGFLFWAQDASTLSSDVQWVLTAYLFMADSREVRGPICGYSAFIDASGKPIKQPVASGAANTSWTNGPKDHTALVLLSIGCDDEESKLESLKYVQGAWNPALLTISFMHCKNVEVQDRPIPEKIAKARAKRGRPPMFKYKILLIEPMKKVIRQEAGEGTDLKRALHICRGHFSHYSPERPLFGKYSGDFWIPQHTRGSMAEGIVVKDYKVKTG